MFNKRIKELIAEKVAKELELQLLNDAPADPIMTDWYKDNLQRDLLNIDHLIAFEKTMNYFKYTTLVFGIITIGLVIWRIINM